MAKTNKPKKLRLKNGATGDWHSTQESAERKAMKESSNVDLTGHRFENLTPFTDITGRVWRIQDYWGVATGGVRKGQPVYHLVAEHDIGGQAGRFFRIRTEAELQRAKTDGFVLLSGVEEIAYRRLHERD